MVEQDGNGGFGLFGLAVPSKEQEALPKEAAALAGLIAIVESADIAPTTDAVTASEKWDKAAEETLARWAAFQKQDLVNANELLHQANLKPLTAMESPAAH
jgi:hypothetical protein